MTDAPIGIFDSGVGGLTVARAVLDVLPHEPVLYVGDTARGPYGPRPIAEVRSFALDVMDHLVEQGVKMLVIACNSASAAVLRDATRAIRGPGCRGGAAGGSSSRSCHAQRARRRDRHAGDGELWRLSRRFCRCSKVAAHAASVPAVRRVRRAGAHRWSGSSCDGARVPRPGPRGRRRHLGARLHALPACLLA